MSAPPPGSALAALALAGVVAVFAALPMPPTVRAQAEAEMAAQLGVPVRVRGIVVGDDMVEVRGAVIGTPETPLRRLPGDDAGSGDPARPPAVAPGLAVRLVASRVHLPGGLVFAIERADPDVAVGRLEGPQFGADEVRFARGAGGTWHGHAARFALAGIPGRDLRLRGSANGVDDAIGIFAAGLLRGRVVATAEGGWRLEARVQHARLADVPPAWLGSTNPAEGIVDGELHATGGAAPLAGTVELTASQVRLDDLPALRELLSALSFQVGRGVPFDSGRARATLAPGGLRITEFLLHGSSVKLDLAAPGTIAFDGVLDLPLRVRAAPPVVGELFHAVGKGALDARRTIRGTLDEPHVER